MGIVDVHSHLFCPNWFPLAFQKQMAMDYLRRRGKELTDEAVSRAMSTLNQVLRDEDGAICLRIMDKVGIEKRVLHVIDWGVELGEAASSIEEINRAVLEVCRLHQDRLIGFASVDPRRPNATDILKRAFDELGAQGLKLHPTSRGWSLEDERTLTLIELAEQRDLPVMVHCGKTVDVLADEHCQPYALVRIAARYERVRFIAAHSGFSSWRLFEADSPANLHFDISAWQERLMLEGEGLKAEIGELINRFPERVFFGTDSPFYGFNMEFAEAKWISAIRDCCAQHSPANADSVFSGAVLSRN